MTLWIILTAMMTIVAFWAAIPFLRRSGRGAATNDAEKSSAVYRDQLRQIESDLKAGVISEAEAEATRSEVARRLVLAEREEKAHREPAEARDRTFAAIGIASAVAVGSAILYTKIGEPDRIASVQSAGGLTDGNKGELPARHPAISPAAAPAGTQRSQAADSQVDGQSASLPTVDGLIERLAQRLKANPEEPDGWRILGWSYASQGRFKEATAAYDEAIKRQPDNGDLYASRGEILVRAGNGLVSPEAVTAFEEAVKRDKENVRARYFLGLGKEQAGDSKAALNDWIALLQSAAPGEPWARDLTERVEQLAAELKVDLAGRLPAVAPAGETGGGGPGNAATRQSATETQPPAAAGANAHEKGDAAAGDDPSAMIRKMVDGLASRLQKQPRDLEGWSRLIRSRAVLGETQEAKSALAKAREVFADTPEALAAIAATSREVGLEP